MPTNGEMDAGAETASQPSRNPGMDLDLGWIRGFTINRKRVAVRASVAGDAELPAGEGGRRALIQVLESIDLTTLSGDDTAARIRRLCRTARSPLTGVLKKKLGPEMGACRVAAVCVYPVFVPLALEALDGSGISVATVSAGFPHGLSTLQQRVREVGSASEAGAQEIDVVIRREWALSGDWARLYEEVRAFREAAGSAHVKVILASGEMETLNQVGRAALTALMAGADFVKTSTGKEKVNATLPAGMAMMDALNRFRKATGHQAGLKPSGGIRTALEGVQWLEAVRREMGPEACDPSHFRIGASSLLDDVLESLGQRYE